MADGDLQAAANAPAPESAPAEPQNTNTAPPAEENSVGVQGSENTNENRVPQSRFNEVIEQRNRERQIRAEYEARLRELESRQSMPQAQQKSVIEAEAEALAEELGMDKKAAMRLMKAQEKIVQARQTEVEAQLQQYQLGSWHNNLANKYKDYSELSPKMAQAFDSLPQSEQQRVLASPYALEMFYHYVKGQNLGDTLDKVKTQAAQDAYNNKLAKQAATSVPGASSPKPAGMLSREAIANMDSAEYMKRLPEINAWVAKQSGR